MMDTQGFEQDPRWLECMAQARSILSASKERRGESLYMMAVVTDDDDEGSSGGGGNDDEGIPDEDALSELDLDGLKELAGEHDVEFDDDADEEALIQALREKADELDDDSGTGDVAAAVKEVQTKLDAEVKKRKTANTNAAKLRKERNELRQKVADLESGKVKPQEREEWERSEGKRIRDELAAVAKVREAAIDKLYRAGFSSTLTRGMRLLDLESVEDTSELDDLVDDLKSEMPNLFGARTPAKKAPAKRTPRAVDTKDSGGGKTKKSKSIFDVMATAK